MKIIFNVAKCNLCKNVVESKYRHDWASCNCGEIFVDGGLDYLRRGAKNWVNFIDLSSVKLGKNEKKNLGIKKRKAVKKVGG